jgi:DNA-binding transcriptional ArsR family regulator
MTNDARFAEIAALAGDPGRSAMLHALMDGRALTASELARAARVSPQTASGHLARMTTAGLLVVNQQGRHRYHRLASPLVAQMMESIMQVAAKPEPSQRFVTGPKDAALRAARTCYDHLAGRLGVSLADARHGRMLCKPCLDWSERRSHLAGAVGVALCTHSLHKGWVRSSGRHACHSHNA